MTGALPQSEQAIAELARQEPERLAVGDDGLRLTYADLNHEVDRWAAELSAAGVSHGHVVSIWLPPWWTASAVFNAVLRIGAVAHVMSHGLGSDEARGVLEIARPRAVVVGAADPSRAAVTVELVRQVTTGASVVGASRTLGARPDRVFQSAGTDAQRLPGAQALIFTSGTTGRPKGVVHNLSSLAAICADVAGRFEIGTGSVLGLASPIGHIRWVMYGGMLAFQLRGTLLTVQHWRPREWNAAAADVGCDFAAFSPKHVADLVALHAAGGRLAALRTVSLGGSYLPTEQLLAAERVLGARIVRSYGCTEFPSATAGAPSDPIERRCAFDGYPLAGVELELEPVGADRSAVGRAPQAELRRVRLRGTHLAAGVITSGAAEPVALTDAEGWLRTEDFAERIGSDVRIVGRSAELIVRNGENVSAAMLETALAEHPNISDVAIVGEHDPIIGERIVAVVVPRAAAAPGVGELAEFLGGHGIGRTNWPERVVMTAAIPRTSSGKVRRREVWELVNPMLDVASNGEIG